MKCWICSARDIGLAAIVLGYPIAAIIQAIGTGIGLSGAIRFTIMQAKESEEQRTCLDGTTLLMLLSSDLITVLLLVFLHPLLHLLDAEGEILQLTAEYIRIIAAGTVFQLLATGFVPFIRNMDGSTFAMTAMIAGFLTNVFLDAAFVPKWGMAGAALATVLGQAVTMLVAVAPFGLTISPTITIILMNRFLLLYGNEQDVAAYSCISYVLCIAYLLLQGVDDGSQPLISKHYGENDTKGSKTIRRLAYETAFAITAVCVALLFLMRNSVGFLFGASADANQEIAATEADYTVCRRPLSRTAALLLYHDLTLGLFIVTNDLFHTRHIDMAGQRIFDAHYRRRDRCLHI